MVVIFHTSVHFIFGGGGGGGGAYLTERSSVCDFDRTVKFLSNDSQIIATYAEVLKYTVRFNVPEKNILKVMTPNIFVQCIMLIVQWLKTDYKSVRAYIYCFFLAHLSRKLIGELIV